MNMTLFGNDGELDPLSFKTFGIHAKTTTDPIGRFGTGLKYAIAVCLRNDRTVKIKSGSDKYIFSTEATSFRGKEFQQVFCNGEALPFTTELGNGWELWQAYRELCSNAIDEGGGKDFKGNTRVYADLNDINHNDVFLPNAPLLVSDKYCDIYDAPSKYVYFRGIRAMDCQQESRYTYNIKISDLTEDRTIKYNFEMYQAISSAWAKATSTSMVNFIVRQCKGYFEEHIQFDMCKNEYSKELIDACIENSISGKWTNRFVLNDVYKTNRIKKKMVEASLEENQKLTLNKAVNFLRDAGYDIEYKISVSENLGDNLLGLAFPESKEIWLAREVLNKGLMETVSCLLEEYTHIKHGLNDYTPEIQDWCFREIARQAAIRLGEVL